jgi:hypothetical protein
VATVNSLTLDQWVEEFIKLKKLNKQIMGTPHAVTGARAHKQSR